MSNLLIVSGHTDMKDSFANKAILAELAQVEPKAEIDYLADLYPDFKIDVAAEQQKLINADVVVFQFPLFWYSTPSLLSRWIEQVFVHGFSHGSTGDKVKGKKLVLSLTAGAPSSVYDKPQMPEGVVDDLMLPLKKLCDLTGMVWSGFVFSGSLSYANRTDPAKCDVMTDICHKHVAKLEAHLAKI